MDVVILAHFTDDFSEGDNGRFSYLATMLANEHDVEIVTSDFDHIAKKPRQPLQASMPYQVAFLHESGYPKNICLKRLYSHRMWASSVQKYLQSRKTPDVIYAAIPSLDAPLIAAKYCEARDVRFVIDVQDLWPEAFKMVFDVPVISGLAYGPLEVMANEIYKRADAICGVSDTYVKRAISVSNKCKSGTTVFLGTDLGVFDKHSIAPPIVGKESGEIWVGYCGTLGASYDLTCVIDAISLMGQSAKLVVMGDGPRQSEFEERAKVKGVDALFTGRLKYGEMCSLLSACDIAVNPITHKAAGSIINKHADYVAAGLPIVSTQENEEFRKLINDYHMGFNCENGASEEVARKLQILIENADLRRGMGCNARRCAEEKFDRRKTYELLVAAICG